jgi:hypothetical protein
MRPRDSQSDPFSALKSRSAISALALTLSFLFVSTCRETDFPPTWSTAELLKELATLEQDSEHIDPKEARLRLEEFARRAVHASIEVSDAAVMSLYQRGVDWRTRPYFAVTYDRDSYVYLDQIDAGFQADLARHSHWASLANTAGNRQLMFELALDRTTFDQLRVGCRVDFTCELAAVIRGGKSIYCRAIAMTTLDCEGIGP